MKNGLMIWNKSTQSLKAMCYAGGLVVLTTPNGRIHRVMNWRLHKTAKMQPDPMAHKRKIKRSLLSA